MVNKLVEIRNSILSALEQNDGMLAKMYVNELDTLISKLNQSIKTDTKSHLYQSVTIGIKILKLQKDIPITEEQNFKDWVMNKAKENGSGKHKEYFDYNENVEDAIEVTFVVFFI